VELGNGVIGIGGVGIGLLNGPSAHFLFNPTLILVAAVGLIINTQSGTAYLIDLECLNMTMSAFL
jgi:hypothetical protein